MTRRGFFARLGVLGAAALVPWRRPRITRPATGEGLSIRFVRDYDVRTDQWVQRYDVLYGYAAIRPELAARVVAP